MKRLLYQIHRWAGVALALFMFIWFSSGLVIMYASPSALGRAEQLDHAEPLDVQAGWLGLGAALTRGAKPGADAIADARLVRQGGAPVWLAEDVRGQRIALSAIDGSPRATTPETALRIAAGWIANDADGAPADAARLVHLDTGPQDSAVRNHDALRPFHRIGVGDSGRELLISARTGEVVRDSTPIARGLYWAGNWIHLLRVVDLLEVKDLRRDVLMWLGFVSFAASLTGLIIGWQRWRPGFGGRPTYSQGRVHPYRDVWNTWHFWAGLIGGTAALLWGFSGYVTSNPFQLFSPATPTRDEVARYQGAGLPRAALDWRPTAPAGTDGMRPVVELAWRRLGDEPVLIATTRDGDRIAQAAPGAVERFSDAALLAAVGRVAGGAAGGAAVASHALVTEYDSYYYPRHHQGQVDRPLPVLRVDLADAAATRFYLDPQDGRLLLRQDGSRRAYRWLYSALHHWDFGWLSLRPAWDLWMLSLVGLGIVLGATSVVLGWKRLRRTFGFKAAPAVRAVRGAGSPAG